MKLVLIDPALAPDLRTMPDLLTVSMFAAYFTPGVGKAVISRAPVMALRGGRGVGHVPQLEVSDWTAEHLLEWLGTQAKQAAQEARGAVRPTPGAPSTSHG